MRCFGIKHSMIFLLSMCLAMSVQAGQALWAYAWLGSRTITENGVQIGTLSDYIIPENEDGDGPYLSYRIKVTMANLQEFFLDSVVPNANPNLPPDYYNGEEAIGLSESDMPPGEGFSGNSGMQFNIEGELSDYNGAIFTMEIGLASWEDAGDDNWYMSDFSLIGYATATTEDLSDGTYSFFGLGPNNIRAWCPDIIVDTPVPEPSTISLFLSGLLVLMLSRKKVQ